MEHSRPNVNFNVYSPLCIKDKNFGIICIRKFSNLRFYKKNLYNKRKVGIQMCCGGKQSHCVPS